MKSGNVPMLLSSVSCLTALAYLPPSDYCWIITEHVKVIKYFEDTLSIVLWTQDWADYDTTQIFDTLMSKTVAEVWGAHILVWLPSSRLPTHWDWWLHSVGNHPKPHHMSSIMCCRGVEPLSPPVPGSHVCSLGTRRRTESISRPDTVKHRPAIFPEYHFMLGAPRPGLDILCLIQIRGPRTIFSITSKK